MLADDAEVFAKAVAEAMRGIGYHGEDTLLGLASGSCLVGYLDAEGLPRSADEQTLLYALEGEMPTSAEELTADFIHGEEQIVGIAVTNRWLPLLQALEAHAVQVRLMCPWSLVAVQTRLREFNSSPLPDIVVWTSQGCTEVFQFQGGKLAGWVLLYDRDDVPRHLQRLIRDPAMPLRLAHFTEAGEDQGARPSIDGLEVVACEAANSDDWGCRGAEALLTAREVPVVDLRRGELANAEPLRPIRRPLTFAMVAVALLMLSLAGVLEWRAWRYEAVAAAYQQQQEELLRQLLPNQPIPAGIRSRLESELARLSGESAEDASLERPACALTTLVRALQGFPADRRYRITQISITGRELSVNGEVLKLADASTIAERLKKSGFDTASPTTSQSQVGYAMAFGGTLLGVNGKKGGAP